MASSDISGHLAEFKNALERRDRRRINAAISTLLSLDAALGDRWQTLAMVAAHNLEWPMAIAAVRHFVEHHRGAPAARLELGMMLHRAGRLEEARATIAALPENVFGRGVKAHMLGVLDTMLGHGDRARANLMSAVTQAPDQGHHWLALAMSGSMTEDTVAGDRILAAEGSAGRMRDAGAYAYARGKALADRDRPDDAFAAFRMAGRLVSKQRPYNRAHASSFSAHVIAGNDRSTIAAMADRITLDTSRPIIVSGNPRSGTTLVEQILASHSAVADGQELGLMRVVAEDIDGVTASALSLHSSHGNNLDDLSATYLHLLDARFGPVGRIVDKTLLASNSLGLIATLLPDAPLIWLRRGALDNAWSCFRTFFVDGNEWSSSLTDCAHHFALEDRLYDHWRSQLGDRILTVEYEDLVRNPTDTIRRIATHCDLPVEPAMFEPHKTRRSISTASVSQARAPISMDAVGAAAPYRAHLQPFIDAYAAAGGSID